MSREDGPGLHGGGSVMSLLAVDERLEHRISNLRRDVRRLRLQGECLWDEPAGSRGSSWRALWKKSCLRLALGVFRLAEGDDCDANGTGSWGRDTVMGEASELPAKKSMIGSSVGQVSIGSGDLHGPPSGENMLAADVPLSAVSEGRSCSELD